MLASAASFAAMGAVIKSLAGALPTEMVVFFRALFGLGALLPWLWWHRVSLRTRRWPMHLARGLAGITAMYCFFYALAHLPLGEAVLLNYSAPLFVPFIAFLWLRERVPGRLWWAIGIGFAGIVLVLRPGLALFSPTALVGLASGVLAAIATVGIRGLTRTEPAARIVFYFSLTGIAVSALPLPFIWVSPTPELWVRLLGIGALATIGQLLLTAAYAAASAARVGPFSYSAPVLASVLGWWFWAEAPDLPAYAGAALVVGAGILALRFGKQDSSAPEK